jgi:transposase
MKSYLKGGEERMLTMAQINDIREMYFLKGLNLAQIERKTGHDRKTIKKYLNNDNYSDAPGKVKTAINRPSKLDNYKAKIDSWLEDDKKYRKKQRHTAKRVYDRLKMKYSDFNCSYRLVADYVKRKRTEIYTENSFALPLEHKPGEAQADFGEAQFYENGTLVDGHYFNLSFPYSNGGYTQMFKGENMECFIQGMKNIFLHMEKVPHRIWFDNASALVTKILKGGKRNVTDKFLSFKNHYGFEAVFCNPYSGNEKGSVENKVGYHRRNLFVPVPEINDLEAYNRELLERCDADMKREHYRKEVFISELFTEDLLNCIPCNTVDFEVAKLLQLKTDNYAKIRLNSGAHVYSTAPKYSLSKVWVSLDAIYTRILDENYREIVKHKRLYGKRKQESMKWIPYLTALSRKPNALKYTGVYDMLPSIIQEYVDSVSNSEQSKMLKQLAKITEESGFEKAVEALTKTIEHGVKDPDSLMSVYTRLNSKFPEIGSNGIKEIAPDMPEIKSNLSIYDKALNKGGVH